ncbi:MAG TPA: energy-coupling factor transporter transmembrane component T [Ruminiclostridium sp.]|nr:energy-coupling factor transporter transmembrane component T [Ruminiclostridium sp.]
MIKDITLGQFFPGETAVHRLDPRTKIVLTIAYMVGLFCSFNAASLLFACVFMLIISIISKIPLRLVLKGLKPIIPIVIITSIINAMYIPGHVLFSFYFIKVTYEGVRLAVFVTVRLIFLIVGTSMMTYTTSPIALSDGIEELLSPLKKIKLPVHELSMMMSIALRFIPTLIEETDKIMNAQKARGADFESGNLMQRIRALLPILIPLFVSAFRRAEELALAMDCRCYQGGEGRTRLRRLRLGKVDYISYGIFVLFFAVLIVLNIYIPHGLLF